MKVRVDSNDVITGYALVGDLDNSINVDSMDIPEDFFERFAFGYFKLDRENNKIIVNPDYHEPTYDDEDYTIPSNNAPSNNAEIKQVIGIVGKVQKQSVKIAMANDMLMRQNANLTKDILEIKKMLDNKGGVE